MEKAGKKISTTLSKQYPEVNLLADKYIPAITGHLRDSWIKGFIGLPTITLAGSAYERYQKKGRADRKLEGGNLCYI